MKSCLPLRTILGLVAALSMSALAGAAPVLFTGTFTTDDQVEYYQLSIAPASTITLETYSYGGSASPSIAGGGFEPIISLFSGSGMFLASSDTLGVCGSGQQADASTGFCGDAYLQETRLASGTYYVTLSQFFNVANGPELSNGFLEAGMPSFTGDTCGVPGGKFMDTQNFDAGGNCVQRNGSYALSIDGAASVIALPGAPATVPEPASILLTTPAFFWIAARRRRNRV